jgi:hypothetical protein
MFLKGGVASLANPDQVNNSRVALEPFLNKVITPKQYEKMVRKYTNQLEQYGRYPSGIRSPKAKGINECPTSNGQQWKAFRKPEAEIDKKLGQQWTIDRRDALGRPTKLFCYPDAKFDGNETDFIVKDKVKNPPVDLNLFTQTTRSQAVEGLRTLVDLIVPQSVITDLDLKRQEMTNTIIEFQRDANVKKLKKTAVEQLAKILRGCTGFRDAYVSVTRKNDETKAQAKEWVEAAHAVAVANFGLSKATGSADCETANGFVDTNERGVKACVPTKLFNTIRADLRLPYKEEKDKVIGFLTEYSQLLINLYELQKPKEWEKAFFNMTKAQRELYLAPQFK